MLELVWLFLRYLNCAFKAAAGKAFTMVRAGFAFTVTSLPKAILLPALVAGLCRLLTMHTPGIVNLPVFFTSEVTNVAKLARIPATAAATPLLLMAFAPFIAFITIFAERSVTKRI